MKKQQIRLSNRTPDQNKAFLKDMYQSEELRNACRWFDKMSGTGLREKDEAMNLERFLESMDNSYHFVLQIGSPFPRIRYCASSMDNKPRYCWVECALTEENHGIVARLFQKNYGEDIEQER